MRPTLTYSTVQKWCKDCDHLRDQNQDAALPDLDKEGRLQAAAAQPSSLWRALSSAGRLVGLGSARNTAAIGAPVNALVQASAALSEQAGIHTRAAAPVTEEELARLTIGDLRTRLQDILNTPGVQLARVHERLDEILQLARQGREHSTQERLEQLPAQLHEAYRSFCWLSGRNDAVSLQQFTACLKKWQDDSLQALQDKGELEGAAALAFTQALQHCEAFGHQAQHQLVARRAQGPTQTPPPAQEDQGSPVAAPPQGRLPGAAGQPQERPRQSHQAIARPRPAGINPLPQRSQKAFTRLLDNLRKTFPEMTQDRLLTFLYNPDTGDYDNHLDIPYRQGRIEGYLQLQKVRPDAFPDADFVRARAITPIKLYALENTPAPGSAAFTDWVRESAELVKAEREARQALQEWEPGLEALMPEQGNFRHYLAGKVPGKKIPEAIPAELLDDYRQNLKNELRAHLRTFGPHQMNENTLRRIFTDCCETLLIRWDKDYEDRICQRERYNNQQFDWLDRTQHSYLPDNTALGFVGYVDATAYNAYIRGHKDNGDKFRISVHPHDYRQAWPLVAEILHRNNCPFSCWKSTRPWRYMAESSHERLNMGGQFTLYATDNPAACQLARFDHPNIARALQDIETTLHQNGIRPGLRPYSDASFSDEHPYLSYRCDMDKTRQYYEHEKLVDHQRRREYMDEPLYQGVARQLN